MKRDAFEQEKRVHSHLGAAIDSLQTDLFEHVLQDPEWLTSQLKKTHSYASFHNSVDFYAGNANVPEHVNLYNSTSFTKGVEIGLAILLHTVEEGERDEFDRRLADNILDFIDEADLDKLDMCDACDIGYKEIGAYDDEAGDSLDSVISLVKTLDKDSMLSKELCMRGVGFVFAANQRQLNKELRAETEGSDVSKIENPQGTEDRNARAIAKAKRRIHDDKNVSQSDDELYETYREKFKECRSQAALDIFATAYSEKDPSPKEATTELKDRRYRLFMQGAFLGLAVAQELLGDDFNEELLKHAKFAHMDSQGKLINPPIKAMSGIFWDGVSIYDGEGMFVPYYRPDNNPFKQDVEDITSEINKEGAGDYLPAGFGMVLDAIGDVQRENTRKFARIVLNSSAK